MRARHAGAPRRRAEVRGRARRAGRTWRAERGHEEGARHALKGDTPVMARGCIGAKARRREGARARKREGAQAG